MIEVRFIGEITEVKAEIMAFLGLGPVGNPPSAQRDRFEDSVRETATPLEKAKMHTMTENASIQPEKKRGRPPGAKNKEPVGPVVEATPLPQSTEPPSEKDVQNAVIAVNEKFGIDKAIECVKSFGVNRAREIPESKRQEFIAYCDKVLGK